MTYMHLGREMDAVELQEAAHRTLSSALPQESFDIAISLGNLAAMYAYFARDREALTLQKARLKLLEKIPANRLDIAQCLSDLGCVYSSLRKPYRAMQHQADARSIRADLLPRDHILNAESMHQVALLHRAIGQRYEALRLHEEALEMKR